MAKKVTPESRVKAEVREYLKFMGWFIFPVMQGPLSHKGISDFIALKDGHILFIECKAPGGRMSNHQKLFELNVKSKGGHYLIAKGYEDVSKYIKERGL